MRLAAKPLANRCGTRACLRLFERGLNAMEVATVSGHKTLAMLKRYTHLHAEELARKLT